MNNVRFATEEQGREREPLSDVPAVITRERERERERETTDDNYDV